MSNDPVALDVHAAHRPDRPAAHRQLQQDADVHALHDEPVGRSAATRRGAAWRPPFRVTVVRSGAGPAPEWRIAMLPLRDLLRDLDVRVVAGEAGLDRAVRWVHISELADPTPWLSGGELLLTTGLQLGDDAQQRDYVARLVERGLTGLGFGAGFSHDARAAARCAAAAEAHGFPLFEVPYELPFIAVTEKAFTPAGQRAVRRAAARAVGARAARADRAVRARAGRRRRRAGGDDRRPGAHPRRPRRGAGRPPRRAALERRRPCQALVAELRERTAPAARARGYRARRRGVRPPARALALPVARAPQPPRRRPAARGLADRRQGRTAR